MTATALLTLALVLGADGSASESTRRVGGQLSVPAVSGDVVRKARKLELSPSVGLSLNDAFYRKGLVGGGIAYHLGETVSLGASGGYAFARPAGKMQICAQPDSPDVCGSPTLEELQGRASGRLLGLASADLVWSPLYGKVSLFAESFLNFDLFLQVGPAVVAYHGPTDDPATSEVRMGLGGRGGFGARFYVTRWFALRASAQALVYGEERRRGDLLGKGIGHQLLVELGPTLLIPFSSAADAGGAP